MSRGSKYLINEYLAQSKLIIPYAKSEGPHCIGTWILWDTVQVVNIVPLVILATGRNGSRLNTPGNVIEKLADRGGEKKKSAARLRNHALSLALDTHCCGAW